MICPFCQTKWSLGHSEKATGTRLRAGRCASQQLSVPISNRLNIHWNSNTDWNCLEDFRDFDTPQTHFPVFDVLRCVSMCFDVLHLVGGPLPDTQMWDLRKLPGAQKTAMTIWIIHMDNMDSGGWLICDVNGINGISCSIFEVVQESTLKTSFTSESALRWKVSGAKSCAPWSRSNSSAKC